ncbi:hypothetical protein [Nocardioides ungokensis]|uniref:hypothetical protein n=1 Tax=Nocardioides ungokensis TaxID=1643322 RepID=UPI0015DE38DF|nr:hypothetical protein [Nocardioides ungokensis]
MVLDIVAQSGAATCWATCLLGHRPAGRRCPGALGRLVNLLNQILGKLGLGV